MNPLSFDQELFNWRKLLGTILLIVGCSGSSHAATATILTPTHTNVFFAIDHYNFRMAMINIKN